MRGARSGPAATVGLCAVLAALSAWHAVTQRASDVRTYHEWITGPLPSWQVPGPYPVFADLLWWPLRWLPGPDLNPWWLLGWTGPATVAACLLLWRTAARPATAVSVWLLAAAILERSYWMRLEPVAALCVLAMLLGVRRGRVARPALVLSAGSLVKVWPAFLLPVAIVVAPGGRARGRLLGWFALPWALYGLAVAVLRPPAATTWFTFTLTRRLQAESLSALPGLWAIVAGDRRWTVTYTGGLDSADLVLGPYLQTLHLGLEAVGVGVLVTLAARWLRWSRSDAAAPDAAAPDDAAPDAAGSDRREPGGGTAWQVALVLQTAVLLVLIFAGAVFSPQYLVWFAPVLVVAAGDGLMTRMVGLWLLACALTTAVFPFQWGSIRRPQWEAVGVLTLRDAVLIGLLVVCVRSFWSLTAPAGQSNSGSRARPAVATAPGS